MPNWCLNTLDVLCDTDRFAAVEQSILRHSHDVAMLDFALILPEPDGLPDADSYWWRVNNWGTKWNVDRDEVGREYAPARDGVDYDHATYRFSTAWAPPIVWVAALSERFPDATITIAYDEPGVDVAGYAVYVAGEEITGDDGPSLLATLLVDDAEDIDQYAPHWTDRSLFAARETHDRRQK